MQEYKVMKQNDFFWQDCSIKELVIYGILYPVGLILLCGLAEWLESLC